MYLTKEEERVYDGEQGWAYQIAMKILVRLGDLFGADRLIPIETAHLSGVSYKTTGDAATDFLQALVDSKGRVRVKSTTNPSGFDEERIAEMRITRDRVSKQRRLLELYGRLGADRTLTCTPYYIQKPRENIHLAWAESSAVVYANSVLGSFTNREGAPSALAAALIGKTPNCGLHKTENRKPTYVIDVEAELESAVDYGLLGFTLGSLLRSEVPHIQGLKSPSETGLKHLGAAMASSGMASMFTYKEPPEEEGLERIVIDEETLKETLEETSSSREDIDLVYVGCPHCSRIELRTVARLLEGRKVRRGVQLWVCTSRHIREREEELVKTIEGAGGIVLCDTCAVVTWLRDSGIEALMTNSVKTAHYAPSFNKVEVRLATLKECIEFASEK